MIYFLSDLNTGTAVGYEGTIIRTTDGGETWLNQTKRDNKFVACCVCFTDTNTGTAVGSYGTILRTTNGGAIWTSQISGTTGGLEDVSYYRCKYWDSWLVVGRVQ